MTEDRITYNEPGWLGGDYAVGMVDEIVLSKAGVHFEMSTNASGYLHVWSDRRVVFARVRARAATREERRQILASDDDRLRDHLRSLVPSPRRIWSVPVWRRPASAVRGWWEARRWASVVLCVDVEDDSEPEATS